MLHRDQLTENLDTTQLNGGSGTDSDANETRGVSFTYQKDSVAGDAVRVFVV